MLDGGNNFWPSSYSQRTGWLYIPALTACELVTNDVAIGLKRSLGEAEDLKVRYGTCDVRSVAPEELVPVEVIGDGLGEDGRQQITVPVGAVDEDAPPLRHDARHVVRDE